jgi:hypothetical protein
LLENNAASTTIASLARKFKGLLDVEKARAMAAEKEKTEKREEAIGMNGNSSNLPAFTGTGGYTSDNKNIVGSLAKAKAYTDKLVNALQLMYGAPKGLPAFGTNDTYADIIEKHYHSIEGLKTAVGEISEYARTGDKLNRALLGASAPVRLSRSRPVNPRLRLPPRPCGERGRAISSALPSPWRRYPVFRLLRRVRLVSWRVVRVSCVVCGVMCSRCLFAG